MKYMIAFLAGSRRPQFTLCAQVRRTLSCGLHNPRAADILASEMPRNANLRLIPSQALALLYAVVGAAFLEVCMREDCNKHCRLTELNAGTSTDDDRAKRFFTDVKATNHAYMVHPETVALTHVSLEYCQSDCGIYDQDVFDEVGPFSKRIWLVSVTHHRRRYQHCVLQINLAGT
jgi:hypothetical protein